MALTWAAAAPETLEAWELRGRVRLVAGGEERAAAASVAQGTIVYFEPDGGAPVAAGITTVDVEMRRKEFTPRVVAVPRGGRVAFPNRDPILHNAFSVSAPNTFDLGLYRAGEGEPVSLDHPGVVRVFCNVHHSMVAYVLVLETPYSTRPAADGAFALADLPERAGTLTVWNDQAEPWSTRVAPGAGTQEVDLRLERPLIPAHTNKFGKPYKRDRRRRAY